MSYSVLDHRKVSERHGSLLGKSNDSISAVSPCRKWASNSLPTLIKASTSIMTYKKHLAICKHFAATVMVDKGTCLSRNPSTETGGFLLPRSLCRTGAKT